MQFITGNNRHQTSFITPGGLKKESMGCRQTKQCKISLPGRCNEAGIQGHLPEKITDPALQRFIANARHGCRKTNAAGQL